MNNNNLRSWRKKNKKSADEVASCLGISASYLRDLETGRNRFNEDVLNSLFNVYGLSANWILNHNDEDLAKYDIVVDYVNENNISPEKLEKLLRHLVAMFKESGSL